MPDTIRRSIVVAIAIGLVVALALALFSDLGAVRHSLATLDAAYLPAILGFTLLNYALRWLKWEYYLRHMQMHHGVGTVSSVLLFTSGMVMAVTPGKIGEVLKSALLKRINGTSLAASAPIVFAERITDGIAMLLLMGLGLTIYPPARPAFALLLLLTVAGLAALQSEPLVQRGVAALGRLAILRRALPSLLAAYQSARQLLGWRLLTVTTIISIVSWFGECVAFYYVLLALGIGGDDLLLKATFVFAASTLFGLVSLLPGGLGVSEASSAGLLVVLIPVAAGPASAATIIIRFCTLWFGVSLGAIALALFNRRYPFIRDAPQLAPAGEE